MLGKRTALIKRKTKETEITVKLNIDGKGKSSIRTGIGFLDHMLELFAKHGLFDIEIQAKGDLKVDIHHTNEDIGICLGQAFKNALAEKKGIKRFGFASIPMDDALVEASIDISGRASFKEQVTYSGPHISEETEGDHYSLRDAKEFLKSLVNSLGINLFYNIRFGEDLHHVLEALFKSVGRALDEATQIDPRIKGIPSTKGSL